MDYNKIKTEALEQMASKIDMTVAGIINDAALHYVSPNEAVEYLRKITDMEDLEEFDSNGWDWDFWMGFKKGEIHYTLSGSGYRGELYFSVTK